MKFKIKDKKKFKKTLLKIIISVIVIAAVCIGAYFLFDHFGILDLTLEEFQDYVASFGAYGPIIFILISFLQVTFIPIPSSITIIGGSFLFGMWPTFFYSLIGILFGSILAFFLGRVIGMRFVYWIGGGKENVDKYIEKMKGKEKVVTFFMFLFPFFPDDLICTICGILPSISWPFFLFCQIVTRPTSILGNLLFLSGEFIPYTTWWGITIIAILCVLGIAAFVLSMIYANQLNALFDKFTSYLSNKFKRNKKIEEQKVENYNEENTIENEKEAEKHIEN